MNHIAVKSKNVASIGYELATRKMQTRFHRCKDPENCDCATSGTTYEYDQVTPDTHVKFLNALSPGSHFAKHIRPYFTGRKVG